MQYDYFTFQDKDLLTPPPEFSEKPPVKKRRRAPVTKVGKAVSFQSIKESLPQ
jgi:hypothetical protein